MRISESQLDHNESIRTFEDVMNHCILEDEHLMSSKDVPHHAYMAESRKEASSFKKRFKKWNKYNKKGKGKEIGLGPKK